MSYRKGVRILSTLDKIIFLLNESGKTQKELTTYLGITNNAFTDWKSGRIKSYRKHIPQIAEFFHVSTDYLLNDNVDLPSEPSVTQLLKEFLTLTETEKNEFIELALLSHKKE